MLMLGIFGVSTPHYSLAAWINWRVNFDDPMRETASLSPEPACNAMQAFICASELIELGFPVSSSSSHVDDLQGHPSGVEPAGSCASVAASSHLT